VDGLDWVAVTALHPVLQTVAAHDTNRAYDLVHAWLDDYLADLHASAPHAVPSMTEALAVAPEWWATTMGAPIKGSGFAAVPLHNRRPTIAQLRAATENFPDRSLVIAPALYTRFFGRDPVAVWLLADAAAPHQGLALVEREYRSPCDVRFRLTRAGARAIAPEALHVDYLTRNFTGVEQVCVSGDAAGWDVSEELTDLTVPLRPLVLPQYTGARPPDMVWSLRELTRIMRDRGASGEARRAPHLAVRDELDAWRRAEATVIHARVRGGAGGALDRLTGVEVVDARAFRLQPHATPFKRGFLLEVPRRALTAVRQAETATWAAGVAPGRLVACETCRADPAVVDAVWLSVHRGTVSLHAGRCRVDGGGGLIPEPLSCAGSTMVVIDAAWRATGIRAATDAIAWPLDATQRAEGAVPPVIRRVGNSMGSPRVAVMASGRVVHSFEERFDEMLRIARAFAEEHGHLLPKKSQRPEGTNLYMWLMNQERRWSAGTLEPERREALGAMSAWHGRLQERGVEHPASSVPSVDETRSASPRL